MYEITVNEDRKKYGRVRLFSVELGFRKSSLVVRLIGDQVDNEDCRLQQSLSLIDGNTEEI